MADINCISQKKQRKRREKIPKRLLSGGRNRILLKKHQRVRVKRCSRKRKKE